MHYFNNFKGFAQVELDLSQPLTILIGPNGSGKSNVIEAVELLSFIARGGLLYEISDIDRGGKEEVRGGLQGCLRYNQRNFTLGFNKGQVNFENRKKKFDYSITIKIEPTPHISQEKLYLEEILIFETVPVNSNHHTQRVRYNNFSQGGKKPLVSISPMQSVISQYQNFALPNKKYHASLKVVNTLMNYLRAAFVFDPNPKMMREYERIGNRVLNKKGSNLSAVLYALSQGTEAERQSLQRLLNWIKQLPNEPYQQFEFVKTSLNDVIFGLKEAESGYLISANVLSDGTLRCLAVLTALETVTPGSRVIIEEFDNGLHPSRVDILVKAIEDCCERRQLNVLVTTHNPATLNALPAKQLEGVILCVWDKTQQASRLIRLPDLPYQDELLERGHLGDLVTRKIIDQYLAPDFESTRKAEMLAWLANF
ncbi:SMC domain-containing protein [Thioploca ingrica]|uniref:SMC domain-containing protein n=1 Tax=Thioploca ingrica TaxID=40754 RepID=A0A090BVG4_9GAMM|nr:SMC domain-containing protein [Thioploca ingrica]